MKRLLILLLPVVMLATYTPITEPFSHAIARSLVSGYSPVRKFGHNPDVDGAFETVSHVGGLQIYLTSAEQVKILSNDVQDDDDSTGARTLFLKGLDGSYAVQSETLITNGTTAVTAALSYLRIFNCYVITAGTDGTNKGTIFVTDNGGTDTLMQLDPLEGNPHAAVFTVPDGQTMVVTQFMGSESSAKGAEIHFFMRPFGGAWRSMLATLTLDNYTEMTVSLPFAVPAKTDIELRAIGVLNDANIMAGFFGYRYDN